MNRSVILFAYSCSLLAQSAGTVQTIAGTGPAAFSGDGGPATAAALNVPVDVSVDRAGNLFIADQFNHRIRKVTPSGTISSVAGTGVAGFSGDNGPATSAQINTPTGIFADNSGNLYIADVGNQRIRMVNASGIISTIAGNGAKAFAGDGGPATSASFYNAVRVAVDGSGNILIADQSNHRIRRIAPTGIISTIAGNGAGTPAAGAFSGDGGPATAASLNNPTALAIDPAANIYFSDQFNHRIRKIAADGTISTVAGNGTPGFSGDGASVTAASLNYPGGLAVDAAGNIYFNDDVNYRLRQISNGLITTLAGTGSQNFSGDGGPATAAAFNGNFGVAIDLSGNIFVADSTNNRIREIFGAVPGFGPVISPTGFTNAASFATGGSPGGIATIFGQHLSRNLSGFIQNSGVPLPASLAGTSVTIDGKTAPLFSVVNINGQEQISVQVPVDSAVGSSVQIGVSNGFATAKTQIALSNVQPGIFTVGSNQAAALHADFSLVTTSKPAAQGETIIVFCTGIGTVTPAVATGAAASSTALSSTTASFTATIAGQNAPVAFSGLAPGFVALGQVNLVVPAAAPSGLQDLVITGGSTASNTVKVAVR